MYLEKHFCRVVRCGFAVYFAPARVEAVEHGRHVSQSSSQQAIIRLRPVS
jgi:hypothetical protein